MLSDDLKDLRKDLKMATNKVFSHLLDKQHRFDFVDEKAWDDAESDEDYDLLETLAEDCATIQITGSNDDYYVKLLAVDSKGGLYVVREDDLYSANWVQFHNVHGSYYEIEVIEQMETHLK
jgi:hypothetical protein